MFRNLIKNSNSSIIYNEKNEAIKVSKVIKKDLNFFFKLGKKKLILIISENTCESILGYLASLASKNTCMIVDKKTNYLQIEKVISKYKPDFIFANKNLDFLLDKYKLFEKFKNFNFYQTKYKTNKTINKNLALLLTTSGSTGTPKFVRISYSNLHNNTKSIIKFLKINNKDISITTMPMSYTYGLSVINTHLFSNASIVLNEESLFSKKFWDKIGNSKITNLNFVPFLIEILQKLKFEKMKFKNLRMITTAGGPLKKESWLYLNNLTKKKIIFVPMYGATEATSRMSYLPKKNTEKKIGSIGKGLGPKSFYLIDQKNKKIKEPFINGELVFKGKNVCLGYASSRSDLSKGDENRNIFNTKDIGYRDQDGFYYLIGRNDRFIKIYGNRINLDEVENIFNESKYKCICKGKTDLIIIYSDIKYNEIDIVKFISKKLGINILAFKFKYIKHIPKNKNGKIAYSLL